MRVSEQFHLAATQPSLDFVDVDTATDITAFIDPRAIRLQKGPWAEHCQVLLSSFFGALLDAISQGNHDEAFELLGRLGEPNETHFGYSRGSSRGRGLGGVGADRVLEFLGRSRAAKSGLLEDLEDSALLVPNIGKDITSDIATHVLRRALIGYTQQMCLDLEIPLVEQFAGPTWSADELQWTPDEFALLPRSVEGEMLLLVPKVVVRHDQIFDKDDYYNGFLIPKMEASELQLGTELVRTLKHGAKLVTAKDLKNKYGNDKPATVVQTLRFPEALDRYREQAGVGREVPDHPEITDITATPPVNYRELLGAVKAVAPGPDGARWYHRAVKDLLAAVFFPALSNCRIEDEINEGRKRIDIAFDNTANFGFFRWAALNYFAPMVPVECKNYTRDLANPELDQIAGRFSRDRGKVGFIVCRELQNKDLFRKRCRDTAKDGNGFILALDDRDLEQLVDEVQGTSTVSLAARLDFPFLRKLFSQLI
jgi:hypothetical protein